MTTPSAIIVAGLLIATAIVATNRYEMQMSPDKPVMAWRLNQLTGDMMLCVASTRSECFVVP